MNQSQPDPVLNEHLWQIWVQRGKVQDQARARTSRIVMIAVALLAAGGVWIGLAK